MKYKVVLEESEEGFAISVPGLPGCHSQGSTEQEAIENIKLAIQEYLQVVEEMNKDKKIREIEIFAE
jgi:predicted RNase H-like HicB family nuclease